MTRLIDLAQLRDGWLDEDSVRPLDNVLRSAYDIVGAIAKLPEGFSPAPLPDGGVRFEWRASHADHILELEADGGMYFCVLRDTGDDVDREFARIDTAAARLFVETSRL